MGQKFLQLELKSGFRIKCTMYFLLRVSKTHESGQKEEIHYFFHPGLS